MNLTIGNNVSSILYNGNPVSELIFNGHSIWKSAPDYWNIPMTFEILTDGVITTTANGSGTWNSSVTKYRLNGGEEQTFITGKNQSNATSITVHAGDKITWTNWKLCSSNSQGTSTSPTYYSSISATCQFKIYGNLALTRPELNIDGLFYNTFKNCTNLVDVQNLIIPYQISNTPNYVFGFMFQGCTSITKSPKVYISCVVGNQLHDNLTGMFSGCTNLNEVTCLLCNASNVSISISSFIANCASSGTLIISPNTNWTHTGTANIPTTWTIQDYSPQVTCIISKPSQGDFNQITNVSNMKYDSSHTANYCSYKLSSSSSSTIDNTGYIIFDYTNMDSIPSNARILGVTCRIRYKVNNSTYVSELKMTLCSNTTEKGIHYINFRSTSDNVYSIDGGMDWTLEEVKTARVKIVATHNKSTSNAYVYIYGADLHVLYEI